MIKKDVISIVVSAFVLLLAGCTSSIQKDDLFVKTQKDTLRLERMNLAGSIRLDEMDNKILILKERVDENRMSISGLRETTYNISPPERLKVVKLDKAKKEAPKSNTKTPVVNKKPEDIYYEAQDLFFDGELKEAEKLFRLFVRRYPKNDLADNALYWIGEAYYSINDYNNAIVEFKRVVAEYPKGNKVPDSLLKIGFSYTEIGNKRGARKTFIRLIKAYPDTAATEKARAKLKELNARKEGK